MIQFASGKSIGKRPEQQDSLACMIRHDGFQLHLIADGMGGEKGGRLASQTAIRVFLEYVKSQPDITDPKQMLLQALEKANRALCTILQEQAHLMGMGTTFIGLLIHEATGAFSFISVGDSPLYRFHSEILERINANHSYMEELKRMASDGRMHWGEIKTHPARHQITSAVTGGDIDDIDLRSGNLEADDFLLLATDGIQTLSDRRKGDIAALIRQEGHDLENTVRLILQTIQTRDLPDQDNAALILLRYRA